MKHVCEDTHICLMEHLYIQLISVFIGMVSLLNYLFSALNEFFANLQSSYLVTMGSSVLYRT